MMLPIGKRKNNLLKNKNNPVQGFTLVELLLVVIILSIISGIAIPSFKKTYLNLQLNNTADNIAYLLRLGQARAVTQRSQYRLVFNPEFKSCWLEKEVSINPSTFERLSSKFSRNIVVPSGIIIQIENRIINIYPDGKFDPVEIYLKNRNEKTLLISTIGSLGYVEVQDFVD